MTTIFSILATILKFFGFVEQADKLWKLHEACVKAQDVANAPLTDDEWDKKAKDGDL
jgi:hypothetical protein